MRPLRILIVMVEPPLPFGNAAARWYYVLLKGLVERGHRVTAFATCGEPAEVEEAAKLFPSPAYDLRCFPYSYKRDLASKLDTVRRPYSYMFSKQLQQDLDAEFAKGFDVLHLEQLWSGWVGLSQPEKTLVNVLNLLSFDLSASRGTIRDWVTRRVALRAERILLRQFPRVRTLSQSLTEQVLKINSRANVVTIPLGMDMAFYEFRKSMPSQNPPTVSLIGSFNWLPTAAAGLRVLTRLWPAIHAECPDARLQLVGHSAGSVLASFGGKVPVGVSVAENVPDILPYFHNTDVLLYPARLASGMKVKVLEAFALGVPVVTTSAGVEGLPACDGVHAGIAEDDAGLIARTVSLLRNSTTRQKQGVAARELVENYCSPARTLDLLEGVYQSMVSVTP